MVVVSSKSVSRAEGRVAAADQREQVIKPETKRIVAEKGRVDQLRISITGDSDFGGMPIHYTTIDPRSRQFGSPEYSKAQTR